MRIAIVDDDSTEILFLSTIIKKVLSSYENITCDITTFIDGEHFLNNWKTGSFDLIILDIYMNELTGVDVARKIRQIDSNVLLVFCSSSNEFAMESYEVNAHYYLQKPVKEKQIRSIFNKIIGLNQDASLIVTLPDGYPVLLRQLLYAEYANRTIAVYLENEEPHILRCSAGEMEKILLSCEGLCSPYKGIIVNLNTVEKIEGDNLVLKNNIKLPITRRKLKEINDLFTNFCLKQKQNESTKKNQKI